MAKKQKKEMKLLARLTIFGASEMTDWKASQVSDWIDLKRSEFLQEHEGYSKRFIARLYG